MKLVDLEAEFLRREIRPCTQGPNCSRVSPHTQHEYLTPVESIDEADGVMFLCPKCFAANGECVGMHSVICWRPRVPPDVDPKPGRYGADGLHMITGRTVRTATNGSRHVVVARRGEIVWDPHPSRAGLLDDADDGQREWSFLVPFPRSWELFTAHPCICPQCKASSR